MKKNTVVIVFTIFFLPVLLAVLLHSRWLDWRPAATRNYGELIQPVVPLGPFELRDDMGQMLRLEDLLGRWQLVHVVPAGCGERCLEAMYWLRQVRAAQDRHQPDIGILLISGQPLSRDIRAGVRELARDIRRLAGPAARELIGRFPDTDAQPASYILDPAGNIILAYQADADPNGIRKDLRRLLTWTKPR